MIEFLVANFAPIMFCGLIVFLLMGYSLAFSLGACGLFFGWLAVWASGLGWRSGHGIPAQCPPLTYYWYSQK